MPAPCIYTTEQLEFMRREYLSRRMPPREVTRSVNEKFGTTYTKRQISALVSDQGWAKRRKIARVEAANSMDTAVLAQGHQRAELATIRDIVDGHARLGKVITAKAEKFAQDASSAKTLSSAASAARVGISIIRDALGLNSTSAPTMPHAILTVNFAHSDESPFSSAGRERQRLAEMKRAEIVPSEPAQEAPSEGSDAVSVNARATTSTPVRKE
jgi:hypothetical protein